MSRGRRADPRVDQLAIAKPTRAGVELVRTLKSERRPE